MRSYSRVLTEIVHQFLHKKEKLHIVCVSIKDVIEREYEKQGLSKGKQAVCVYADSQMVFYNRSFMASGKKMEKTETDHSIMRVFHKWLLYFVQIVF